MYLYVCICVCELGDEEERDGDDYSIYKYSKINDTLIIMREKKWWKINHS